MFTEKKYPDLDNYKKDSQKSVCENNIILDEIGICSKIEHLNHLSLINFNKN